MDTKKLFGVDEQTFDFVWAEWPLNEQDMHTLHGPEHWARVSANGRFLLNALELPYAQRCLAEKVMKRFALFHDCQRRTEGPCAVHGYHGEIFMLKHFFPVLQDELGVVGVAMLRAAVTAHTMIRIPEMEDKSYGVFGDVVGACMDADRLDLRRVGIMPDSRFMFTDAAKRIALVQGYGEVDAFAEKFIND